MIRAAIALSLALAAFPSLAADRPTCSDASRPRASVAAHSGKWIELTKDQWQFLRGVFVLNPNTPAGLPYGDRAALAQVDGDNGGVVFLLDDARACTPMPIPPELVTMLRDVGEGTIPHEPSH